MRTRVKVVHMLRAGSIGAYGDLRPSHGNSATTLVPLTLAELQADELEFTDFVEIDCGYVHGIRRH